MKRCRLWMALALLLCVAVSIVFVPHSSLAYITAKSNILHNSFRVVYLAPEDVCVPLRIEKVLINMTDKEMGLDGFEFELTNLETGEVTVLTSGEDGWTGMDFRFTGEDVDKTYRYRLSERDTGRKYMIYDDAAYDICITLRLNEIHELFVEMTVNGKPVNGLAAKFVNMYSGPRPLPETGGGLHPLLWAALLVISGVGLIVVGKKCHIFRRPK